MKTFSVLAASACTAIAGQALAAVTATQGASAPTFSEAITFDEAGTPTGLVPSNYWASQGITITDGSNPSVPVGNVNGMFPWVDNSNVADGSSFGLFLTFAPNATEVSFQLWSSAGAPGPFGGLYIYANDQFVNSFTPAWGGTGDTWYTVSTTDGSEITSLAIIGGGIFPPAVFMDNLSWNQIPAPGALALLGLALAGTRRRR